MACNCNTYNQIATGGLSAGGQATLSVNQITGGLSCGGSAHVAIDGDVWDGMLGCWPLDEIANGSEGEFEDLTVNELHGTGGLSGDYLPTREAGVFCLYSQSFDSEGFIRLPLDAVDNKFSFSFWTKIDDSFRSKVLFTRGSITVATRVWYSIARHIMFEVYHSEGSAIVNTPILDQDRWYHVACEYDASNITIYLNGATGGTIETTETLLAPAGQSYIGADDMTGMPEANMQELRLWPEAKGPDYFLTEYRNFCDPNFIDEGEGQSPVYS